MTADVWPQAKAALRWALAEQGRLRLSPVVVELVRGRALLRTALGFALLEVRPTPAAPSRSVA